MDAALIPDMHAAYAMPSCNIGNAASNLSASSLTPSDLAFLDFITEQGHHEVWVSPPARLPADSRVFESDPEDDISQVDSKFSSEASLHTNPDVVTANLE